MLIVAYSIIVFIMSCFLIILGIGIFNNRFREKIMFQGEAGYYAAIVIAYICVLLLWIFSVFIGFNQILK